MRLNSSRTLVLSPIRPMRELLAQAASRAGDIGIVELSESEFDDGCRVLHDLREGAREHDLFGARVDIDADSDAWDALGTMSVVVIAATDASRLDATIASARRVAEHVVCEVCDVESARAAEAAGADGLLVKGHEAAGRVGDLSTFILLQRLDGTLDCPYWVQGGIGLHNAAAARLAGAGIALREQLWLTSEARFTDDERERWRACDGSETEVVGPSDRRERVLARTAGDGVVPLGQEIVFAGRLERSHSTVADVLDAFGCAIREQLDQAASQETLAPDGPMARAHGTRVPVVQGPMTRVSDGVPFAAAVADAGGLPTLALAVLRPEEIQDLLDDARAKLEGRPWGVGILGFLPPEQLEPQLAVVREAAPPFAVVAGGNPALTARLEAEGTRAYLHAPSPALLTMYLRAGARCFVLEGNECGGHTGPRSSFLLWDLAVGELLDRGGDLGDVRLLFAGGIHDALSAAMVAAIAAPVVERGALCGLLMGTAYLFTDEIVQTEALLPTFQARALECERTALLEAGPGYTTRCARTPFVDTFETRRRALRDEGRASDEVLWELERLNVGRLRLAAKGVVRDDTEDGVRRYVDVGSTRQHQDGLYMLGEVATLVNRTVPMAQLHADVSEGAAKRLRDAVGAGTHTNDTHDIAIVGMACIFPGGADLRAYWRHIVEGRSAVREVDDSRWRPADYFTTDREDRDGVYVRRGCFLDDILFDPTRYGIAPVSMRSIEPLQLLAVDVARRALDDANGRGRPVARDRTAVVFATGGSNDLQDEYVFRTQLHGFLPKVDGLTDEARQQILDALDRHVPQWTEDSFPGTLLSVVAGRVANRLDLRGGNFTVDAACASSLAALDVAVEKLRARRADVVVVGAADGSNNATGFTAFSSIQALSPDARSRPFDDAADGLVMGEGVGAVVLKRRADAERDGNRIYAVVKGVGSSSDGRHRSLVAPHVAGQVNALRRAYADADVSPKTVGLIEAHGTGTALGDPTEVAAITRVFGRQRADGPHCALGSVKSSIGHTKTAAGLAGLIKGALALHQRVLPPTVGVEVPNERIPFATTPVYINAEARPWLESGEPRRCGVSAFGFGGTNFHAVMEEYVPGTGGGRPLNLGPRPAEPICITRSTREALREAIDQLRASIAHPETLDLGRFAAAHHAEERARVAHGSCRLALVAGSGPDLVDKLDEARGQMASTDARGAPGVYPGEGDPAPMAFLFPGQGSQRIHMMRDLLLSWPRARSLLERFDGAFERLHGRPLSAYVEPRPVFTDPARATLEAALDATDVAQPALGVFDLIALDVLSWFGLRPDVVAGHSFGEYVALAAAGVLTRDELVDIAEARGRLVAEVGREEPGAMASVSASIESVRRHLAATHLPVEIANLNAPDQTVLGGPVDAIDAAVQSFVEAGMHARRIPVTAAFHTSAMGGAAIRLAAVLADVPFRAPDRPVYSNALGRRYPEDPDEIRGLLADHIRQPVRFRDQIDAMYAAGVRTFVECGPGSVLSGLVGRTLANQPHAVLTMDVPGRHGLAQLAHLLGRAFALGHGVNFGPWFAHRFEEAGSLADVLADARAQADPPATAWRINVGKAVPVTAAPVEEVPAERASRRTRAALRPRRVRPSSPALSLPVDLDPRDASGDDPGTADDFQTALLNAVSARTGYHVSMLPLDAHMEGDLGIDSIKRMEILGSLTEFGGVLDDPDSGARLAEIARLRTLQSIIDWFEANAVPPAPHGAPKPTRAGPTIERLIVTCAERELDPASLRTRFSPDGAVLVVGQVPTLSASLVTALREAGHRVLHATPGGTTGRTGSECYSIDSRDPSAWAAVRDEVHAVDGPVASILYLSALEVTAEDAHGVPLDLLLLLQAFESDLLSDGSVEGARVVVLSALGGRFGLVSAPPPPLLAAAGVTGVARCAAREWPGVRFQLIDVDPSIEAPMLAARVMAELEAEGDDLEVGLSREGRFVPELRAAARAAARGGTLLPPDAVVLVTGGARGITASTVIGLARRSPCRLVIVGRSPWPEPESEATRSHPSVAGLRRHLLEQMQIGGGSPADAEAAARRILRERDMRATFEALAQAGARVEYHALDVRDRHAFGALVDDVYARHGRIDGVIHGAGVIEDRRIRDKAPTSFRAVFETKVVPAEVLASRLRPESLRFLIFFSSVAGRLGSEGQSDYAAANEVLNKLACHLAEAWPTVHVAAIGWGPWEGGMVDDAVRLRFAARGIDLIPADDGVSRCLVELEEGRDASAEVLITTPLDAIEQRKVTTA